MKRGVDHFFDEASKLYPYDEDAEHPVLTEVAEGVDRYKEAARQLQLAGKNPPPMEKKGKSKVAECEHGNPSPAECMICQADTYATE